MKKIMTKWKWILMVAMVFGLAVQCVQGTSKASAKTDYLYGDFAVTELTSTSVSIDYRNLYYEVTDMDAEVLGYRVYLEDYTDLSDEKLVANAAANQVYGTLPGLTSEHSYSIKVEVDSQFEGSDSDTFNYYVFFKAPSAGESAAVDVISEDSPTAAPTGTQPTSTSPTMTTNPTATTNPTSMPVSTMRPGTGTILPTATPRSTQAPAIGGSLQQAPQVVSVKMIGDDVGIVLNNVDCDGYEYGIYKKASNQLVQSDTSAFNGTTIYGLSRKSIYYVKARTYSYDSNGNKVYSQWSHKKYFVPQPVMNKSASKLKKNSIRLTWSKVAGATKYTIYMRKRGRGKWSKVKTLNGKKGSYKITRYKGKPINTIKNNFDIKVKASAKIGGTTYHSTTNNYIYTYTYTRYTY